MGKRRLRKDTNMPEDTKYATAVWILECAADDRDKTASTLTQWADYEHPGKKRTEEHVSVVNQLLRESYELRAAAEVLKANDQAMP